MRKIYLVFLVLLLSMLRMYAQSSSYVFTKETNTYTPLTGGTVFIATNNDPISSVDASPSHDSKASKPVTIPAFTFAGVIYTEIRVTSNGHLVFGETGSVPTSTYQAISSTFADNKVLAPFGADLNVGAIGVSNIKHQTIENETVVEWNNFRRYGLTESFSFQIRLNHSTGVIKFIYKGTPPFAISTSFQPQIGIKNSPSDYQYLILGTNNSWSNAITSSSNVASTSLCIFNGETGFSDGLTYVFTPSTCYIPTNFENTTTSNSATLTWQASSSEAAIGYAYEVRLDTNLGTPGAIASNTISGSTLSANITNLLPNTLYHVFLKTNCGDGTLGNWIYSTFRTLCVPVTDLPYTENFDYTETITFPYCWFRYEAVPDYVSIQNSATNATSGTKSLRIRSALAESSYAISPQFSQNIETLRVKFNYKRSAASAGKLELGILTDPTDVATFIPLTTIDPTNTSFNPISYQFNSTTLVSGGNNYIALRQIENTSTTSYFYIDDFVVETIPLCIDVLGIQTSNPTSNSINFAWTEPTTAPAGGYLYEIRSEGEPGSGAAGLAASGNVPTGTYTATANGLLANTEYKIYMQSSCGTNQLGIWSDGFTFKTSCNPIPTPYSMNFDASTSFPDCWSHTVGHSNFGITTSQYVSSPNSLRFAPIAETPLYVATPAFTDNIEDLRVRFRLRMENTTRSGTFTVGVVAEGGDLSNFHPISTVNLTTASTWGTNDYIIELDNEVITGPNKRIVFKQSGADANYYYWLDNVIVERIPTCSDAEGLTQTNITSNSITIAWDQPTTNPSLGYRCEVRTSGEAGSGSEGLVLSGNIPTNTFTTTITGLSPNTVYKVYLISDCGVGEISYWSQGLEFNTLCAPTEIPYIMPINETTGSDLPECIINERSNTSTWTTTTTQAGIEGRVLRYYSNSNGPSNWIFSRGLNLTAGQSYRLEYKAKASSTTAQFLRIKLGTETKASAMNTAIDSLRTNTADVHVKYKDFTPTTTGIYYIGFEGASASNYSYLYLGEVEVKVSPTCREVEVIRIPTITNNSARIEWELPEVTPANGYAYEIRTTGLPESGATGFVLEGTAPAGQLFANITGLNPNIEYTFYVRSVCSTTDSSNWSRPIKFKTDCDPSSIPYTLTVPTSGLPECVVLENNNNDGTNWANSATTVASLRSMYLGASSSIASDDWFYTRGLTLEQNQVYRLKFTYKKGTTTANQKLKVMYGTDNTSTEMTTLLTDVVFENNLAEQTVYVDFIPSATATYYIGFHGYAQASQGALYVGNISVNLGPDCFLPINNEITNVTKNSAVYNFGTPIIAPAQGYEYQLINAATSEVAITGTMLSTETTKQFTNLIPSTGYILKVRSVCSADEQTDWLEIGSFTTLCNYPDLVSSTPATRCGVGTVELSAIAANNGSVSWFASETGGTPLASTNSYTTDELNETTSFWVQTQQTVPNTTVKVGNGTTTTSSAPGSPFTFGWGGYKFQYIFTAEELLSFGLAQGEISSIGFNITANATAPRPGFTIYIGNTTQSVATTSHIPLEQLTHVYSNENQALQLGVQNFDFNTPDTFTWDGESNIVLQISWSKVDASSGTSASVEYHTTSWVSTTYTNGDRRTPQQILEVITGAPAEGPTGSTNGGTSTSSSRPNTYFNGTGICSSPRTEVIATVTAPPALELSHDNIEICEGQSQLVTVTEGLTSYTNIENYVWSPNTGITGNATTGWTFAPTESTNYTLRVSTANGDCVTTVNLNVVVNENPSYKIIEEEYITCVNEVLTLDASSNLVGATLFSFNFDDPNNLGFTHSGTGTSISVNSDLYTTGSSSIQFKNSGANPLGHLTMNDALNLSSYTNLKLKFDNIAALESYLSPWDLGLVEYSLDGGITWNTFLKTEYEGQAENPTGGSSSDFSNYKFFSTTSYSEWIDIIRGSSSVPTNNLWKEETFILPPNSNLSNFKLRFTLDGDSGTQYEGWFIDNVRIIGDKNSETVWSPVTNLYTDAAATIPYLAETPTDKVYFKAAEGTAAITYTAVTSNDNCSITQTTAITVIDVTEPVIANQTICEPEIANIVISGQDQGGVFKWYATEDATEEITSITETGTYYVEQVVGECKSDLVSVVITYNPTLPAPLAEDQIFCEVTNLATVADLVATGVTGTIGWFLTEAGETPLELTDELVTGTYYVAQFNGNCWSEKTAVEIESGIIPVAPIGGSQSFCGALNLADVPLTVVPGGIINWYDSETSTNKLPLTDIISNRTYYISQSVGSCESARVLLQIAVIPTLPAPTAPTNILYCEAVIFDNLEVNIASNGVKGWFSSATLAEPDLTLTAQVTTGTYYVAQFNGACWSPKTEVKVTVNQKPLALNNATQQLCGVFTLADANLGQATGATLKFYTSATSTTTIELTTPLVTGIYYVSQVVGGCESDRVQVSFEVAETLIAPQVETTQFYCGRTTFADLDVTPTTGVIGWFTSLDSTTPQSMTNLVQSGTYFVAQRNAHCWSEKVRVQITVNDIPANLNNTTQLLCGTFRFEDISIGATAGSTVNWYASNGTTLLPLNGLAESGTYFISQTMNGCESPRLPITLTVTGALNKPIAGTQTICGSGTVSDLEAEGVQGAEFVWYTSATSNVPLATNAPVTSGTYYVAQTMNGCYSERRAVAVRVISITAPQVSSFVICGSGTISDLIIPAATGVTHSWYTSPTSTNALAQNTPLTTGVYFVERNHYGCISERTAVQVTIGDIPNSPTGDAVQTFIEGTTISYLRTNQSNVVWYATFNDSQNGNNPLSSNMPLVNGSTYYGVLIGTNGCPSLPLEVKVDIYLSNDEFVKSELKYYPNPVVDILNLSYSEKFTQIEVFDLLGKRIKTLNVNDNNVELDLSDLSSGTYMIQLKSETKEQFIKIVKK